MSTNCARGVYVLVALLFAAVADGATLTLAWDANAETNIAGYKIHDLCAIRHLFIDS